ncbi:uncharacterized protein Z518_02693 [Rhinocladiella mackenziei CBS 650.93]|uniref:Major facilitator superfamily (MFS) profile domain-containing protein n=1 Tax=Rhinocladiella mackenziei CBS 650.93 TaxID=1442369 RepID=A0A0D2HC85_9EURO|nr:uncharacterized protein Z518_02693 [Rhinocladiella mackenziei CBS 650.93]KIX08038.1 hypothetical protein Z518_02693 [Rhinocladiella mackenziei CBS 650.93]
MATATLKAEAFDHVELDPNRSESSNDEITWTEREETTIRRKIDWRIVPLVTLLYLLCFLDRANIGNARIQGMAKDLELVGYRFNWALSVFYIIYLLVEVPSNILLKHIGPRFYIPALVAGFGIVSLCTAFVKNFAELCVARAFLGVFEGGTMPGIAFFLSTFYKRRELYFRIGIFISAASIAGAFGGLFATALARIPRWGTDSTPIHTWRNIFFFEGLLTTLVAAAAPIFMPSNPQTCTFLSERERHIAHERLVREHRADPHERVQWHHIKAAVLNVNNNLCAAGFFLINITVQGLSIFMPTILADLGWTATKAQLYSVPPYVAACLVAILIAFISDKTRRRGIYLALATFPPIVGFSILRWNSNASVRYMAVYFITTGAFPGGPGFLSWGINNSAGPAVRAVATAYIVSVGTLGGVLATWTYLVRDAPRYPIGHTINLTAQIIVLCVASFGIAYNMRENRVRDQGRRNHRLDGLRTDEKRDLGHKHPDFRYIP